ncbi:MAG: gliding motility-associated C-terminal domain-containing protein [Saprospiraceae bacterium]|nr:gliding motility-associated C-terminal domain-containing protein [Saprospiraceae bacterium]
MNIFKLSQGPGEKILSFTIFDRWGNKVFDKSDYMPDPAGTDGWDGTLNGRRLDPAVFVYYSRVRFIDGKEINYSGSVTLADKIRN